VEEQVKTTILALSIAAAFAGAAVQAVAGPDTAAEIIALERKTLDGWIQGNPEPALAASDADITYFHVMTEKRLDGLPAFKSLVEPYKGRPLYDSYEMLDPKVQLAGDAAVLTYVLVQRFGSMVSRWNATQVYQRKPDGWRVIHTHYSQNAPKIDR
jgi:hypothetical protein